MKYLLDTHTAMWALNNPEKLSPTAKSIIADTSLHLYVSIISAWEIAIKISINKLSFAGGSAAFLHKLQQFGVEVLPLTSEYISLVETLPPLHRDPFDRLLIATATTEQLTLLTADENIQKYPVLFAW